MQTPSDNSVDSSGTNALHRQRTLYLVRHGEALHNVFEAEAQKKAQREAQAQGLSPDETARRMEEARRGVLRNDSLFDAPLTDKGRSQAMQTGEALKKLIDDEIVPQPFDAMVSPLTRCLETADIILQNVDNVRAHIRPELRERQTQYPPDKSRPHDRLLRWSEIHERFVSCEAPQADNAISVEETRYMLRERAARLFDLLLEMADLRILIVSHKGYLREVERGLLGLSDSPLFGNAELRVYHVTFTRGERVLDSVERLA